MARILSTILLLAVLLVVLFFTVLNADSVTVNYYFGNREVPLSLLLVLTMLVGALLGLAAAMPMVLKMRRRVAKLQKGMRLAEKEVANLRTIPIKEPH